MIYKGITLLALASIVAFSSCKEEEQQQQSDVIVASFNVNQFVQSNCSEADSLVSSQAVPATTVYFQNNTSVGLKIEWINFSGGLNTYKENLAPGAGHRQPTFLTHPWKISITDTEECISIVTAIRPAVTDTVVFEVM